VLQSRPAAKPGADQREAPHGFNRRMVLSCPIGPIDRACLRKLISKSDAACGFLILQNQAGFELRRWHIPERGVKPLLIVDLVQKLGDAGAGFPQVAVFAAVDLFVLERFHKRFAGGVVPRIAFTRHTDRDAVILQQVRIVVAGILRAAIGVMDQARLNDPPRKRHPQSGERERILREFGQKFGLSSEDIRSVTSWLESHGFQVAGASKGRTVIEFSGSVSQVQEAFHTSIHKYLVNGDEHWANAADPQIPTGLAPAVAGIVSLHEFQKKPLIRA